MTSPQAPTKSQITTDDGVRLYVEQAGEGTPMLFIHEFAGDMRNWQPQIEHYAARGYRCISYNARGYPPSDVPDSLESYSQMRAVADAIAVLDALEVEQAHIVGISMGGFCALHLGLRHPDRALTVTIAGCGYGAHPDAQEGFRAECARIAELFRTEGSAELAKTYALGPARVQFQNKNPDGWRVFADRLAGHDSRGSELTMLGVQRERPSLYDLTDDLAKMTTPLLIIAGDEDEGCHETDLMLKRTVPSSGFSILPRTGHTANFEEPEIFNGVLDHFLAEVESGRWGLRDPRSQVGGITGMSD